MAQQIQQFRRYKSATSNYQQPIDSPKKPYTGWRKNLSEGGVEQLVQARYISREDRRGILDTCSIKKKNRKGEIIKVELDVKKAIKMIFDKGKSLDYADAGGVIMYTKLDKKLYNSSLVERIEPGLDGQPVQEKKKKETVENIIDDMIKEDSK